MSSSKRVYAPRRKVDREIFRFLLNLSSTSVVTITPYTAIQRVTLTRIIIQLYIIQTEAAVAGVNLAAWSAELFRGVGSYTANLGTGTTAIEENINMIITEMIVFGAKTDTLFYNVLRDLKSQRKMDKNDTIKFNGIQNTTDAAVKIAGTIHMFFKE